MCAAILIVEDERNIAELLKDWLDEEGFQVKVAYSGTEAKKHIKESSPDAVTLDIYLPDANGLSILQDLKSDPETNRIPVIIISSSEEARDAKKMGALDFISKPIDFKKLLNYLNEIRDRVKNHPAPQ
jgi:DNA-binding response OmpR family regulator